MKKKKKRKRRKKDKTANEEEDCEDEQAPEEESDEASPSMSPLPKRGGALLTEAEILASRKRHKKTERGAERTRARIAEENKRWERMKKNMPMQFVEKGL